MTIKYYIYKCQTCRKSNRITAPGRIGKWKCGACGSVILHREANFHENLMIDCREDLEFLYEEILSIKSSIFSMKKVNIIGTELAKVKSRLQNWEDHVEFISSTDERMAIKRSYEPDLIIIKDLSEKISQAIEEREWLKNKLEKRQDLRLVLNNIAGVISVVANILTVFGIQNGLQGLVDQLKQNLVE